jgi:RNA polymerase-binding transcription factor DksA
MPNTEQVLPDDEVFVLQQNEINEAIHRSREALYKPSDVIECIDCGDDIPPERKIFIPSTERCTPCAEAAEKRKR